MQAFQLNGARVTLGDPMIVAEGTGHVWFPSLLRFAGGEVMCAYQLVADGWNHVDVCGLSVTQDGGQTWLPRYDVTGYHGGRPVRLPHPDGSLVGPAYLTFPDPPDSRCRLCTAYVRHEAGGERWSLSPFGVQVEGLPKDLALTDLKGRAWSRRPLAAFYFYGDAVQVGDGYLTAAYCTYEGEKTYTEVILRTEDLGHTWHYLSTVGDLDDVPDRGPGGEGPDEASLLELENGDLMCTMRVGGGTRWPLARAYSSDGGQSWSPMDRLPAWSVCPSTKRLQNGMIALSTGRPGIRLWLADDPKATCWQSVDVQAYHNATMGAGHQIRVEYGGDVPPQTTAYTDVLQVAPNRLWLVYDRTPFGWHPVPIDSEERSRIYVLSVDVDRT